MPRVSSESSGSVRFRREVERFDPAHSDVDFLVEFAPEAEPRLAELYLDLIAALRNLLGREVDLVMIRAIRNPYFRQVIDRSRRTLYAA